nr:hypothetical protein BCU10_00965 [Vibrio splendidus]PMK61143.1 hypothetical protein BCT96_02540 [Vibrio splendidus]
MYLVTLFFMCFYISLIDVKNRIIRNSALLVLCFTYIPLIFVDEGLFLYSFFTGIIIGTFIYPLGLLGGGDIKYAAVLSLSLPMGLLPSALLLTMLTGGVLASFYLLLNFARRIKANANGGVDDNQYNTGIPYGVAISVGFYVMIFSHWVNYI